MVGFDPQPEVPPAPPPYPDGERGARYAMTPSEFDARVDAWRERALSGRLDAEIRQSRAFRDATFARELWRTAAFVLATFPITTGALLALNPALPPVDPDTNPDPVARMLARVGQCDRWGGAAFAERGDASYAADVEHVRTIVADALHLLLHALRLLLAALALLLAWNTYRGGAVQGAVQTAAERFRGGSRRAKPRRIVGNPAAPEGVNTAESESETETETEVGGLETPGKGTGLSVPPKTPPSVSFHQRTKPAGAGADSPFRGFGPAPPPPAPPPPPPPPPKVNGRGSLAPLVRANAEGDTNGRVGAPPPPPPPPPPPRGRVGAGGAPDGSTVGPPCGSAVGPLAADPTLHRSRGMAHLRRTVSHRRNARLRAVNAAANEAPTPGAASRMRSQLDSGDVLTELRARSSFLAAAEREAETHADAIANLRRELEALDGTATPDAISNLRDRAEKTLETLTDEPRVLKRLDFPQSRLECLRAAAANGDALAARTRDADALFRDEGSNAPSRARAVLDACVSTADAVEAARRVDESRFLAAGIAFDWTRIRRAREAAVGMTGRYLAEALERSRAARAGTRTKKSNEAIEHDDEDDDKENAASYANDASRGRAPRKKVRWGRDAAPPGAKELGELRAACDLAYKAYARCGGASVEVDALAEAAVAEIEAYGDDVWRAAEEYRRIHD